MTKLPSTLEQYPPEGNFMGRKRQDGSGSIVHEKNGLAIRWPEYVLLETGARKRKMRYEFLGPVSSREANKQLNDRIAKAQSEAPKLVARPITFSEYVARWQRDILDSAGGGAADIYKFSVRETRSGVIQHRIKPQFGHLNLQDISVEDVQQWITALRKDGLAATTIQSYVRILRVILAAGVKWKLLKENPAESEVLELPKSTKGSEKRKKWALTVEQAGKLIQRIQIRKVRTMIILGATSGLRRGELVALRWKHLDEAASAITVKEASYRGHIDTPKTFAGIRTVPLHPKILELVRDWRRLSKHTRPDDFVFATRTGKQEHPTNILRRYIYPACEALGMPRVTWNNLRQTFSTWTHHHGTPAKALAEMMGHANPDTPYIYIQADEESKRVAADKINDELSRWIVQMDQMQLPYVN